MLQNFLINLLVKAAQDERVQQFVADQVARLVDRLKADLLPDLIALLPTFGSSVVKAALDNLPGISDLDVTQLAEGVAKNVTDIIDSDPDLPIISEYIDISEILRKWLRR